MRRFATRTLILSFCLISLYALAQENRIVRVGVAMMQSQAGHSMSGAWGQDRLVAALNQQKPDKKQHIKLQGVPLEGTGSEEVANEAKQKNCDYVVYTNLVDLQAATDSTMQPRSGGTMQTYPGGSLGMPPNNPNNTRTGNTQYRATMDYRLYRAGDAAAITSSSLTNQQSGPEENVVAQVLSQVANRVFAEVRKAPPATAQ
jgi:hypothetical protein